MIQKGYVVILLLVVQCVFPKRAVDTPLDTLTGKSFEYLHSQFGNSIYNPAKSKIYVSALLKKAKNEKVNYEHLALAYKACIINADQSARLIYADSMINYALLNKGDELIGSSYLTKGIIHYSRMEHIKALDNYIIADRFISRVDNPLLSSKTKYEIAKIKYYLGFYDEAIALLTECVAYFKEENDRAYLNSLHMLGLCYTKNGKYDWASQTNDLGINEGRMFDDTSMESYFEHSRGINFCYQGNYKVAIKGLKTALPEIIALKDYANEAIAYFHIGKSYWALKRYSDAVTYFKKVDDIFQKKGYMLPDLRKGYEYLIDFYKERNDTQSQLFYINQLLKIDRILAQDYKYLLRKIVKEYDTKELIKAKNAIENTVLLTRIAACVVVLILIVVIIYLIHRNRRNQKLFEELMNRDTAKHTVPRVIVFNESEVGLGISEPAKQVPQTFDAKDKPARTISPDIEAAIVKKLEKFEGNKKYLEKDMTVRKMAALLHTNDKYVTKIIAKHRGKGTIEYITDLKLDYIVEMLKTEGRYRNYTHKALGEEAGFRTTQHFTNAFKSYTGITPTYFIYKLKKAMAADNSQ
ncbi:AraC family transcriptional regulator [Flavobacterium wongokense]|uniref:AraC family transcriptional regulator n=1 Tax=Flavobacterium wongokense TaxID=2910674 RepID=UPI001F194B4E|nr:AraC family transcriptional regulator [Flavobacterium sp. WG47]MCF6132753.1 helix-turn-helix domain-containing protein [Flavobacterium sp. WG47]